MPAYNKHTLLMALLAMSISININAQTGSKKTGPVYLVKYTDNSDCVISVVETKSPIGFQYQLRLTNCKTAGLVNSSEMISTNEALEQEQIIGKLGGILWILTDSLTGYDVNTLKPVVTETDLATINPFMKDNISRLPNNYLLDETAPVMYIVAKNGDRYKLLPDFKIVKDNSNIDNSPDDFSYDFSADYKLNGSYNLKNALSCIDTLESRLFIIGSKKETTQVLSYFGSGVYPERDEMRQITIIPFNANGDKIDFSKNKPVTKSRQYFGAGFLLKKLYTTAWHGKDGEHLIFYRSGSGAKATLSIAMVDKTGKQLWKTDTGIASLNFNDYIIAENTLIVWMETWSKGEQNQKTFYISLKDGTTQIQ